MESSGLKVKQLFRDYCYYRDNTVSIKSLKASHKYMKPMKLSTDRYDLFSDMVSWCREKNIPPRQWLYTLFAVRRWRFAPKLERSHLCSEKHIPKFYAHKDYGFFNKYTEKTDKLFDPKVDMINTVEQKKREMIAKGGPDLCMHFMDTETFGYHPKSKICMDCPKRFECNDVLISKVGFDILGLRKGIEA